MESVDYFKPVFSDLFPEDLAPDILYISMNGRIAKHLCPCGCGEIVNIILSPGCWSMTYDGETVSISPSIGNYDNPCKSHYFINNNQVHWCRSYHNVNDDVEDAHNHHMHGWLRKFKKKRKRCK